MTAKKTPGHMQGAQEFIIKRKLTVSCKFDESLASIVEEALR
jgi:hypothetical protein